VSGNTAAVAGGLRLFGGPLTLINSTITGNHATQAGGGVSNREAGGAIFASNTIIAGNTAAGGTGPDCDGTLTSQGYNLIGTTAGCTIVGDTAGNLIGVDPLLGPLQHNGGATRTHALLPGSPAIDAANPAPPGSGGHACAATDQRGVGRPQDGDGDTIARCDMGAFEVYHVPPSPLTTQVASFQVLGADSRVTLAWQTVREVNLAGFHIYRAAAQPGVFECLTATPIPAQGNAEAGARYQYLDYAGAGRYTYQLKSVEADGQDVLRAQAEVEVGEQYLFVPLLQR
jgi:hypothetical protein